jgi:hypothetical protein
MKIKSYIDVSQPSLGNTGGEAGIDTCESPTMVQLQGNYF